MPWDWNSKRSQSVAVGGGDGTVASSAAPTTWPNYEAAYLAKRLGAKSATAAYQNRFDTKAIFFDPDNPDAPHLPTDEKLVYLDKVAGDYKSEADECLKAEFVDWLQGTHDANLNGKNWVYEPGPGQMKRRAIGTTYEKRMVDRGIWGKAERDVAIPAGEELKEWKPTYWGTNQLTYLPGVREFLREKAVRAEEHEFNLNLLAEFGPQNLGQAWTYFKHWVKGRPVAPEECLHKGGDEEPKRWDDVIRAPINDMGQERSEIEPRRVVPPNPAAGFTFTPVSTPAGTVPPSPQPIPVAVQPPQTTPDVTVDMDKAADTPLPDTEPDAFMSELAEPGGTSRRGWESLPSQYTTNIDRQAAAEAAGRRHAAERMRGKQRKGKAIDKTRQQRVPAHQREEWDESLAAGRSRRRQINSGEAGPSGVTPQEPAEEEFDPEQDETGKRSR